MKPHVRPGLPGHPRPAHLGPKSLSIAIALGVFCLALPRGLPAQIARDSLPVVSKLEFIGSLSFKDSELKAAISTRSSGCKVIILCWTGFGAFQRVERMEPRELKTDVLRLQIFYFRRGYRRASVDTSVVRDDGKVGITFHIDEGRPVRVHRVELAGFGAILDSAAILRELPLRLGDPFSELNLTASRETLEQMLRNTGYAQAQVLVQAMLPSSDSLAAYVVLRAEPGPLVHVGEIDVLGNRKVSEADVRRMLTFQSGELYNEDEIIRSQRTLYSMALFDYVDIARETELVDSTIAIRVQVNEADAKRVRFGFGLTTAECFEIEASWTHRNFFGSTRILRVSSGLSNLGTRLLAQQFPCNQAGTTLEDEAARDAFNSPNWRIAVDFEQPWFLGTENWLRLTAFAGRQSVPELFSTRTAGGEAVLTRQIAFATPLSFTYHPEWNKLDEGSSSVLFCVNFGVCRPEDISQLSQTRLLAWISVALSRARTDAVINPTRGYRFTIEGEHASRFTGSDWAYYRGLGEISYYQQISAGVLALRLRGGVVRPIGAGIEEASIQDVEEPVTNPLKRQYAGGGSTVRGFGQNLLGPKVLFATAATLADPSEDATNCGLTEEFFTDNGTWICDPQEAGLTASQVDPRPVGGENGVVANVELRFPLSRENLEKPRRGTSVHGVTAVWQEPALSRCSALLFRLASLRGCIIRPSP